MADPTTRKASSDQGMSAEERAEEILKILAEIQPHYGLSAKPIIAQIRQAEAAALRKALEEAAKVAEKADLSDHFQWSDDNRGKFKFGVETAVNNIRALAESTER